MMIGINVLFLPQIVFYLYNIRYGWRHWYLSWRDTRIRFSGVFVINKWTVEFYQPALRADFSVEKSGFKKKILSLGRGKRPGRV